MSNSSIHETTCSKKIKITQQLTSLNDFFSELSDNTMHIIEISDDELSDSDKTIGSEDSEEEHNTSYTNKAVKPEWFESYLWLGTEIFNEKTILYCKICRNRNGK